MGICKLIHNLRVLIVWDMIDMNKEMIRRLKLFSGIRECIILLIKVDLIN